MSELQQGPDWWLATDGRWYPPRAIDMPPPTGEPVTVSAAVRPLSPASPLRQAPAAKRLVPVVAAVIAVAAVAAAAGFLVGNQRHGTAPTGREQTAATAPGQSVAESLVSAPATTATLPTPTAVDGTVVPPDPGSSYGDLSTTQIDGFIASLAFTGTIPRASIVGFGRSTCVRLNAIGPDRPLDKSNVAQVKSELDEFVSLALAAGDVSVIFGSAADATRQMHRIDYYATKYFCPPFHPAVAAAYPEIGP